MSKLTKALTAAAGNAGESLYVEDVFSTYLYDGNGSTQTITNGIDLAGEGGLVWIKTRDYAYSNNLFDTARGSNKYLISNSTNAEGIDSNRVSSFNSNGFTLGTNDGVNGSSYDYASWTFRKAEKFFDVVTYTGNGSTTYAHSLNAIPAFVLYKATSTTSSWLACTRKNDGSYVVNILNGTTGTIFSYADADAMGLTETTFNPNPTGASSVGTEYVAYLFASDAGGFGDDGSENIIKCGSWDATGNNEVNLGFEPQWILIKNADGANNWGMFDSMRGWTADGNMQVLAPNLSSAESSESGVIKLTSTGFTWVPAVGGGNTYIYIAIRRPMKTPESGTEVFATAQRDTTAPIFEGGFPVDAAIIADVSGAWTNSPSMGSRLTGTGRLATSNTNAEASDPSFLWDYMNGWGDGSGSYPEYYSWMFKRATGFFDVVAYTGDGVAGRTVAHNLGVAPEMIIIKQRNASGEDWKTGVNFTATNNQERALPT